MLANYDRFYLEHVIDLSESEKVIFIEDVFTDKNMKLVERDTAFSPKLYELLRHHRLQKPLDDLIFVMHRLNIADVVARAGVLEKRTPYLLALTKSLSQRELPIVAISRVALNGVLSNKLTVMQKRLPELFDHSIQVSMVAVAIGHELRVAGPLRTMLATAGLLHDMGELHINPVLHNVKIKFTEREWRQIYTHPLVGYALINQFPEVPAPVARAVLEHHERMDGSGYPQNTLDGKLSQLGRILAAAEVVTAICQREPLNHVGTVFKSYVSNLDEYVVQAVNSLLRRMQTQAVPAKASLADVKLDMFELTKLCTVTSRIMRSWKKLVPRLEDNPLERVRRLLTRVSQTQIALLNAGINPENCEESVQGFAGEAEPLLEITSLLRELSYQFGSIINETQRGWNFEADKKSDTTMAVEKWLKQTKNSLAETIKADAVP